MRFRNLSRRTIAIAVAGFFTLALTASFADNLLPQDSPVEANTAPLVDTPTAVIPAADTSTATLPPETSTAAETISNSKVANPVQSPAPKVDNAGSSIETITIPTLIDPQPRITLRVPLSMTVDPRAHSYQTSAIQFADSHILLACFIGHGVGFDVGTLNTLDNLDSDNFIVDGDRTPFLRVSGTSGAIAALLRANGGVRIFTSSGAIAGRAFTFSLTALNFASTDSSYCGASKAVSTSVFSPLKIDLGLVKGQGSLKK
jgi:hypothetical protein